MSLMTAQNIIFLRQEQAQAPNASCRGAILVLVLVSLLLLSTVALHVAHQATEVSAQQVLRLQANLAGLQAEAARDKMLELLQEAAEAMQNSNEDIALPVWEQDTVRITILPTNARFNLNALHPPALHRQTAQRLRRAAARLLDPEAPDGDIQDILNWLGQGHDPDQPENSRRIDAGYQDAQPGYRPRKGPMQRPEELLLVRGYGRLAPEWIRERFTVWGEDSRVNLNLASKEVLLAVAPELQPYWRAIEQYRARHGFSRTDELLSEIRLPMDIYQRILPHVALHGDLYEALVEIRQPAWYELHRIIVEHPGILAQTRPRILAADVLQSRPVKDM